MAYLTVQHDAGDNLQSSLRSLLLCSKFDLQAPESLHVQRLLAEQHSRPGPARVKSHLCRQGGYQGRQSAASEDVLCAYLVRRRKAFQNDVLAKQHSIVIYAAHHELGMRLLPRMRCCSKPDYHELNLNPARVESSCNIVKAS